MLCSKTFETTVDARLCSQVQQICQACLTEFLLATILCTVV